MWKIFLLVAFLSVDAQRLKVTHTIHNGIKIYNMDDRKAQEENVTYRLSNQTIPELYLINLDFGDFHSGDLSFTGNVLISIRVVENTDTIILHNSGLLVVNTMLTTSANVVIEHTIAFDVERELMIVNTEIPVIKDTMIRLTIDYRSTIGLTMSGVYRGSYLHNGSETRWPH